MRETHPMLSRELWRAVVVLLLLIGSVTPAVAQGAAAVSAAARPIVFHVNDAYVKDRNLEGVSVSVESVATKGQIIASGTTDERGRFTATIDVGTYAVTYRRIGYVTIADSMIIIGPETNVVTTSMSGLLEAPPTAGRTKRIRVILNWGTDRSDHVRDVDSHLACPCTTPPIHIFYRDKVHTGENHGVALDVDDTDWGGPETITVTDPPPGDYWYWVHDFPGLSPVLGRSDVVVRVLFDDTMAGEFRCPQDVVARFWRPFKAIVVPPPGSPPYLVPFTEAELELNDHMKAPDLEDAASDDDDDSVTIVVILVLFFLAAMPMLVMMND